MKLIRFGKFREEKPGIILENGLKKDLSAYFKDWDQEFFGSGGLEKLKRLLSEAKAFPDVPDSERIGSPVARPYKVICIGLNYSDHAKESGFDPPKEPIIFMKTTNTVVGPYDNIIIPKNSTATDWEVELGVVISKEARYLSSEAEAMEFIAGYMVCNDVSERDFQLNRGGQWVKGKSCDSFMPSGPWLLSKDEVDDPHQLNLRLSVNGVTMQNGTTSNMIFKIDYLIYYLSQFMTLEPGDIISTGTPPGVGLGMKPPVYLKTGDVVELEVEKLGKQRQVCINSQ